MYFRNGVRPPLHITGLYALRRHSAAPGFHSPGSAAPPTAHSTHSLSALEMLRISLSGPPNRRIQPERYVSFCLEFVENLIKIIDIFTGL
jgi:hypothetical protein